MGTYRTFFRGAKSRRRRFNFIKCVEQTQRRSAIRRMTMTRSKSFKKVYFLVLGRRLKIHQTVIRQLWTIFYISRQKERKQGSLFSQFSCDLNFEREISQLFLFCDPPKPEHQTMRSIHFHYHPPIMPNMPPASDLPVQPNLPGSLFFRDKLGKKEIRE